MFIVISIDVSIDIFIDMFIDIFTDISIDIFIDISMGILTDKEEGGGRKVGNQCILRSDFCGKKIWIFLLFLCRNQTVEV